MSRNRQIAVVVGMLFAFAPAGAAVAQQTGCDFSVCPPADEQPISGDRPGDDTTTGAPGGVEGETGGTAPGGGEIEAGAPGGAVRGESGSAAPGDVAAGSEEAPVAARSQETRAAAVAAAPAGALPVTGGDLAALAAIGMGAVAVGAVLVRRSRSSASVTG